MILVKYVVISINDSMFLESQPQNLSHAGRFIMEISGSIKVLKVSSKYVCNNIKSFKEEALICIFGRDWPNCDAFMGWISDN